MEKLNNKKYCFLFTLDENERWEVLGHSTNKDKITRLEDFEKIIFSFSDPKAGNLYVECRTKECILNQFEIFLDKLFKDKGW